jgi:D-alanyl-D-alanine carboxypeptidase
LNAYLYINSCTDVFLFLYNGNMLKNILKFMLSVFTAVCLLSVRTVSLHADDSILAGITSEYAYVVDYETGQVLAEKNADTKMYPASMTKIM